MSVSTVVTASWLPVATESILSAPERRSDWSARSRGSGPVGSPTRTRHWAGGLLASEVVVAAASGLTVLLRPFVPGLLLSLGAFLVAAVVVGRWAARSQREARESTRLSQELAASSARTLAASDETRRRIERDLHDGAQQRLVSAVLALRLLQADVPDGLPAPS